jgi:DnaJ-class molecular chaperone
MSLNMAEAALGMTKPVPTLEGDDVDVEIPPGTQSASQFRVRGRGVPRIRRDGRPTDRRGDIRVLVDVDIPAKLNNYQRKLVEDLAYSLANNGKAPPAPPRKKRSTTRKPVNENVAEPEGAMVEDVTEAGEPQNDDKQRGLFDRIKDTLTSGGE